MTSGLGTRDAAGPPDPFPSPGRTGPTGPPGPPAPPGGPQDADARRRLRRLLRWVAVAWLTRLGAVAVALLLLVGLLTSSLERRVPVARPTPAPGPARIDAALAQADAYLDGLYRELPDGRAVVSEYYGLPLRARVDAGPWVRAGDQGMLIASGEQSRERESYLIDLSPAAGRELEVLVSVHWRGPSALVSARQVAGGPAALELAVGGLRLADWPALALDRNTRVLVGDRGDLRSLRYTVRHVAMMSELAYTYRRDPARAAALRRTVLAAGYDSRADVYSPLWGVSEGQPDDYLYQERIYRDCDSSVGIDDLPSGADFYPYQSKVCTVPTWAYIALSREDPLVPVNQALHVLATYADPRHPYSDGEREALTPLAVAAELEQRFRRDDGIAECLPTSCARGSVSTLRTALFGALETELGYGYGDEIARGYADAVAAWLLRAQVPASGTFPTAGLGLLHRPDQAGGFFTHVSPGFVAGAPPSFVQEQMSALARRLDIRAEYTGELDTNAETTLAVYAFLLRYRCARYLTGCAGAPGDPRAATPPAQAAPPLQ